MHNPITDLPYNIIVITYIIYTYNAGANTSIRYSTTFSHDSS